MSRAAMFETGTSFGFGKPSDRSFCHVVGYSPKMFYVWIKGKGSPQYKNGVSSEWIENDSKLYWKLRNAIEDGMRIEFLEIATEALIGNPRRMVA